VITAVNPLLEANPETINTDPYGDGWLFELELDEGADLDDLLDADSYAEQVAS
jgi:glycine cleavage system H protein